jgi:hypothetical protein
MKHKRLCSQRRRSASSNRNAVIMHTMPLHCGAASLLPAVSFTCTPSFNCWAGMGRRCRKRHRFPVGFVGRFWRTCQGIKSEDICDLAKASDIEKSQVHCNTLLTNISSSPTVTQHNLDPISCFLLLMSAATVAENCGADGGSAAGRRRDAARAISLTGPGCIADSGRVNAVRLQKRHRSASFRHSYLQRPPPPLLPPPHTPVCQLPCRCRSPCTLTPTNLIMILLFC